MEKPAEFLGAIAVGQESIVPDTLKAVGQNVEQKAADEFVRIQAHRFVGKARLVVLVGKADSAVFDLHELMVGNGGAVGAPRQVIHDGVGAGEGRLAASRNDILRPRDRQV